MGSERLRGGAWIAIAAALGASTSARADSLGAGGPAGDAAALAAATATSAAPTATATPAYAVRVRGRRAFADPTATVSRLDAAALARARVEGSSLGDVTDRLPGARVLDEGGPVHGQRLTVRGGSPAQAQVVIDGVPLMSPFATGLDLGLLSPESIAEATLVRGGAGALLGDGALSGALVVETRAPADVAPVVVALRGGSLGRFGVSAGGSTGDVAVGAEVERSDGRFRYVSRLAGLPDVDRVRENNDASSARGHARGARALGGGRLELLAAAAVREGGQPGFESQADVDARERRASGVARAAWTRTFDGPRLELSAEGALLDVDFVTADAALRTTFVALGADAALSWALGDHRLRAAMGAGAELSRSTEHGTPTRGRGHAVIADVVRLGDARLSAAVRAETVGGDGLTLLPRLGFTWTATAGLHLALAGGRSSRAPAIDELYHPTTRGLAGNPALRPESAWEAELSARLDGRGPLAAAVTGFVRRVDDGIVYVNQNAFVVRPENLGHATVGGVEVELSARAEWDALALSARAAGTWTASALDGTGAPLPSAPPAAGDVELRAAWWPWSRARLEVFTRGAATAATTANLAGTVPVDAYARWDVGASIAWDERWSLAVEVDNLLDDRALESLFKVPLPGRVIFAAVRVEAG